MIILEKAKLNDLKEIWNKLIKNATGGITYSPYSSFELIKEISSNYFVFSIISLEFPSFWVFKENENVICIAPLCRKFKGPYKYVSFGTAPTIDIKDFIYDSTMTVKKMQECVTLLKTKLGTIRYYDVPTWSLLYKALINIIPKGKEHIYTTIPMNKGYDVYYSKLSKSMRQNIRTSYNHLVTDNKTYSFRIIFGKDLDYSTEKELMNVYFQRRDSHLRSNSFFHQFYARHFHHYTIAGRKLLSSLFGILYIDGKIAAFWSGFVSPDKHCVSCPRLAYKEEFKFYSPGIILLCETSKVLKKDFDIDELDLSRHAQDYKMRMGGVNYYSYDFVF